MTSVSDFPASHDWPEWLIELSRYLDGSAPIDTRFPDAVSESFAHDLVHASPNFDPARVRLCFIGQILGRLIGTTSDVATLFYRQLFDQSTAGLDHLREKEHSLDATDHQGLLASWAALAFDGPELTWFVAQLAGEMAQTAIDYQLEMDCQRQALVDAMSLFKNPCTAEPD